MKKLFIFLLVVIIVAVGIFSVPTQVEAAREFTSCIDISRDIDLEGDLSGGSFRDHTRWSNWSGRNPEGLERRKEDYEKLQDFFERYSPGPDYEVKFEHWFLPRVYSGFWGSWLNEREGWEVTNKEPLATAIIEFQTLNGLLSDDERNLSGWTYANGWPYVGVKTRQAIKDISCFRAQNSHTDFSLEDTSSALAGDKQTISWNSVGLDQERNSIVELRSNRPVMRSCRHSPHGVSDFNNCYDGSLIELNISSDILATETLDKSSTIINATNRAISAYLRMPSVKNLTVYKSEKTLTLLPFVPPSEIRFPNHSATQWRVGNRYSVEYGPTDTTNSIGYLNYTMCLVRQNSSQCVKTLPINGMGSFKTAPIRESILIPNDIPTGTYRLRIEGRRSGPEGTTSEWANRYSEAYSVGVINVVNGDNTVVPPTPPTNTTYPLSVTKSGTGSGIVYSFVAGIYCGTDCVENLNPGVTVTFIAIPVSGSTFAGWSGACSGTGLCTVTMNSAKSVIAIFNSLSTNPPPTPPTNTTYSLSVSKSGTGSGTVNASYPYGINCGSDCSESYNSGTTVTLGAAASSGSTFAGWGGACSTFGTQSTCIISMSSAKSVTATFNSSSTPTSPSNTTYPLSVTKSGTGSGTVFAPNISCGSYCGYSYPSGTSVTLTTTPILGSTFAGWSGACSGTGLCTVTMNSAKSVIAIFNSLSTNPPPTPPTNTTYSLSVSKSGTGSGTVNASYPYGINCGSDCSESYNSGTTVTLGAAASSGSTFAGWGGACSTFGTQSTCTLSMSASKSVTAIFNDNTTSNPPLVLTVNSPTSNSTWASGQTQYISWMISSPDSLPNSNIKIELITTSGDVVSTLSQTTGTGFLGTVAVTAPNNPGTYKVRVTVTNGSQTIIGESPAFTVFTLNLPTVNVTVPNSSTSWPAGSTQTISWTTSGATPPTNMNIFLQTTSGWPVGTGEFDKLVPNTGSTQVTLPTTPGQYRYYVAGVFSGVMVNGVSSNVVNGGTSETFTVTAP